METTNTAAVLTTDQKVKQLFDKVQEKKLAIEKAEKPQWETSGVFRFSADSAHNSINIQGATDQRKLVEILAFLIDRKEKYVEAATILGAKTEFTWLSFSVKEWQDDLQTRVSQLQLQEKKKELAILEARLNSIISPELKAQMELEAIGKLLD